MIVIDVLEKRLTNTLDAGKNRVFDSEEATLLELARLYSLGFKLVSSNGTKYIVSNKPVPIKK